MVSLINLEWHATQVHQPTCTPHLGAYCVVDQKHPRADETACDLDPSMSLELPGLDGLATNEAGQRALLERFQVDGKAAQSIAVVGSSGTLRYRKHGSAINQHDIVIRVNGAPTLGFEEDVGRARHHVRVGWVRGLKEANEQGLLCCGTQVVATSANNRKNGEWWGSSFTAVRKEWMQRVHDVLIQSAIQNNHPLKDHPGGDWPSTGFLALAVALAIGRHIGAQVSVFGYGACAPCNRYYACDSDAPEERLGADGYRERCRKTRTQQPVECSTCMHVVYTQ